MGRISVGNALPVAEERLLFPETLPWVVEGLVA